MLSTGSRVHLCACRLENSQCGRRTIALAWASKRAALIQESGKAVQSFWHPYFSLLAQAAFGDQTEQVKRCRSHLRLFCLSWPWASHTDASCARHFCLPCHALAEPNLTRNKAYTSTHYPPTHPAHRGRPEPIVPRIRTSRHQHGQDRSTGCSPEEDAQRNHLEMEGVLMFDQDSLVDLHPFEIRQKRNQVRNTA